MYFYYDTSHMEQPEKALKCSYLKVLDHTLFYLMVQYAVDCLSVVALLLMFLDTIMNKDSSSMVFGGKIKVNDNAQ